MKNVYNTFVLCALFLISTSTTSYALDTTPVGLRSAAVRMSSLEQMKTTYMAPAYAMVNALSKDAPSPSFTLAEEGEQTVGGGLIYGSQIKKIGLQLSYFYFMTAALALGGDLSFFFPEKEKFQDGSFSQTLITINVMAHYMVVTTLIMRAYALAGLNYALFRTKNKNSFANITTSSSELGLNLGGGIEYVMATGLLFLELKYIISNFDQLVLAVGYRHRLGR